MKRTGLRGRLSVLMAAAVCAPMLPAIAGGNLEPSTALLRFLVALAVCWFGMSALANLTQSYEIHAERRRLQDPQGGRGRDDMTAG